MSDAVASLGLPPVVGDDPTVLILGSLPSVQSIELQQYYAFQGNLFWTLMGQIVAAGRALPYPDRIERLRACGIALWDSLAAAERVGSQDSKIVPTSAQANDFAAFFQQHPGLQLVAFNGQTAHKYFQRFVAAATNDAVPDIDFLLLPSTSSAYRIMPDAEKLRKWSVIKKYLR